jgi:hypothetical protein
MALIRVELCESMVPSPVCPEPSVPSNWGISPSISAYLVPIFRVPKGQAHRSNDHIQSAMSARPYSAELETRRLLLAFP